MPRVLPRSVLPTPACHFPAFSDYICSGMSRIAAMTSPQVSSAVA
jgi:hypothetical protein